MPANAAGLPSGSAVRNMTNFQVVCVISVTRVSLASPITRHSVGALDPLVNAVTFSESNTSLAISDSNADLTDAIEDSAS